MQEGGRGDRTPLVGPKGAQGAAFNASKAPQPGSESGELSEKKSEKTNMEEIVKGREPAARRPEGWETSLDWEEWQGDWPLPLHAAAGSIAGLMEHLAVYPIDTIKTRAQALCMSPPPHPSEASTDCTRGEQREPRTSCLRDAQPRETPASQGLSNRPYAGDGARSLWGGGTEGRLAAGPAEGRVALQMPHSPLERFCPLRRNPLPPVGQGPCLGPSPLSSLAYSTPVKNPGDRGTGLRPLVTVSRPYASFSLSPGGSWPAVALREAGLGPRAFGCSPASQQARQRAVPSSSGLLLTEVYQRGGSSRRVADVLRGGEGQGALARAFRDRGNSSVPACNDVGHILSGARQRPIARSLEDAVERMRFASVCPNLTGASARAVGPDRVRGVPSSSCVGIARLFPASGSAVSPFSRSAFSLHSVFPLSVPTSLLAPPLGERGQAPRFPWHSAAALEGPGAGAVWRRQLAILAGPGDSRGSGVSASLVRKTACRTHATLAPIAEEEFRVSRGRFSIVSAAKSLYAEGGIPRFYRGATAVASGCIPAHAFYFLSYERMKQFFLEKKERLSLPEGRGPVPSETEDAAMKRRRRSDTAGGDASNGPHQRESPLKPRDPGDVPPGSGWADGWVAVGDRPRAPGGGACTGEAGAQVAAEGAQLSPIESLICGGIATLTHDVILTPMDVIKQRLQLGCYKSPLDCLRTVLQDEGGMALCRSLPATVLLNVPFGATLVCVNEWMKQAVLPPCEGADRRSHLHLYFFCAAVSGGVAGLISNPLDVIKTRLQTQDCYRQQQEAVARQARMRVCGRAGGSDRAQQHRPACVQKAFLPRVTKKYSSLHSAVRTIFREEGFRGFWRGTSTRIALNTPATGICWGTYETVKFLWKRFNVADGNM
ncbi:mitochondrial carrier superfamily protein [Toxoplasma gondii TgCatPRC2]|uniref:Carrier superfamily protein n=6 Tax=Toxoplasma gondii TaxID=5811 RepID=B6KRI3_TOXGV|nr:carrier superfamily protein [Toxoplasma gondii ME49]EPT25408.1 carrier superfamily protein [Toxoplasma gondii ME49]ESS34689.1 carrier superfamily protein [Toxoplasma gondii VEG]KYK65184.1 mitochondrial carrier superfamily protein [Toxoplasma gondii TgCatPRC2]CEL78854.1 TPA: mitochondrial carrier domain-containing protein [Toxoplasma gondii VEG]|eukprot:XP_002370456.1 carrier superfamily protein [Toxoplasma gondii ME49]